MLRQRSPPTPVLTIGSDDSDELPELQLNLENLVKRASHHFNAKCLGATKLTCGTYHEIYVLEFSDDPNLPASLLQSGSCCIARFVRNDAEPHFAEKEISAIATLKYLTASTSIPVPEVYYHDLDDSDNNDVGAPFVLMERMPGRHLYNFWDTLSLDHKKAVLTQIASVILQFASLRFDAIGCLTEGGTIGPLYHPFAEEIDWFFVQQADCAPYLVPPFAMIHANFNAQNMMFVESADGSEPPKLTGIIDFENAYSGPLYNLYEYPIFIQDVDWSQNLYAENAILRTHFVRSIYDQLLDPLAQATLIACTNEKSHALNGFKMAFMSVESPDDGTRVYLAEDYLDDLRDGTGLAYTGRMDYIPELYTLEGELLPNDAIEQAPEKSESVLRSDEAPADEDEEKGTEEELDGEVRK
ncbi:hypothetical protein QBC35DRAFT_538378 [Podospora australis]|uniref:Aminoglycoside phosphotransferase domain-containing protein n=1 Tax=Podospora australis TaxID=1536484 RepID=A0AAN6WPK8_9PEZI|nr:hypothetical protein QBC35DRAFT_538378 [Podospora australis]